jgi:F420 biosynthesis protein FbiB-like protein
MGITDLPTQKFSPRDQHEFWDYFDHLIHASRVVIDRPAGSRHPRFPEMVYPLDYGYLQGTSSMDENGIDVWVGSQDAKVLDTLMISVDLKKRDAEVKLLLGCSEAEKQMILELSNDQDMRAILVYRAVGLSLIHSRRSVRRFLPKPVPGKLLERVLEAATWAPSSHNRQPWRFVVLESHEARTRLADQMGADFRRDLLADRMAVDEVESLVSRSRQRILEAPVAIVLCMDPSVGDVYPDPERQQAEYLMGVQSVAMAGQNLLLAAHAEGLGGVWICAPLFVPHTVRRALNLPEVWQPQGLLLLGYPAKIPDPRLRRPLSEVTLYL